MPTSTLHDAVPRRAPEPPAMTAWALRHERGQVTYGQWCAQADAFADEIDRLQPDRTRPCALLRHTRETRDLLPARVREGHRVLLPSAGPGERVLHEPAHRAHCSHLIPPAAAGGTPRPVPSVVPAGPPATFRTPASVHANGRGAHPTSMSDKPPCRSYGMRPPESAGAAGGLHHPHRGGDDAAHPDSPTDRRDFEDHPHDVVMENMRRPHPRFPEGTRTVCGEPPAKEADSST